MRCAVQVPTSAQVQDVSAELARRATVPKHVKAVLEALPVEAHPMTQFITAITALQVRTHSSCVQERLAWGNNCLHRMPAFVGVDSGPCAHALCMHLSCAASAHCAHGQPAVGCARSWAAGQIDRTLLEQPAQH